MYIQKKKWTILFNFLFKKIVLSASIFGSASLYAYTRPKDSLISWGSSLYSALFGMIGL